jgi:hypothetical protein
MPAPACRALLSIVDMGSISYDTSAVPPPRLRIDRGIIEPEQRSGGLVASDATPTLASYHGLGEELPPGVESTGHRPHVGGPSEFEAMHDEFSAPVEEAKASTEPGAKLRSAGRMLGAHYSGGVPGLVWLWRKE